MPTRFPPLDPKTVSLANCPLKANGHGIALLGAPATAKGEPSPPMLRRLQKAFAVWQKDKQSPLLLLGGAAHTSHVESEVMQAWLLSNGVAKEKTWTEKQTKNTRHQAKLLTRIQAEYPGINLTVVTDPTHAPRTKLLLFRAGANLKHLTFQSATPPRNIQWWATQAIYEAVNMTFDTLATFQKVW